MIIPSLSETSDYGSGTDLEFQSIQHFSPQATSSPFVFDFEPTTNHSSQPRRISLSSSSSSSSSTSTSPSSSMSNLSSLSSSSELPINRSSIKKYPLLMNNNNNHHTNISNESSSCQCEKENNLSNRRRNRFNSYPMRRLATANFCENCQLKRNKSNYRSKYSSNRSSKQRSNPRSQSDQNSSSVKFSVDLTGLNINYTIEYHDNLKCKCLTTTNYTTYPNRCKCSPANDWSLVFMMNSISDYNHDWYYLDTNNNSWYSPMIDSSLFNYNDFYLTRTDHPRINNLSAIYFDEQTIFESNEHLPAYYLRCTTPAIEFEREENTNRLLIHDNLDSFFSSGYSIEQKTDFFLFCLFSSSNSISADSLMASSSLAESYATHSDFYRDELQYSL